MKLILIAGPPSVGKTSLTKQILNSVEFNEYNKFDVIVDFLCYKPEHAHADIELFNKMTNHFIFISSTAVYKRPYKEIFANETSQLDRNTTWGYAYNKIQCEEIFKDAYKNIGFPMVDGGLCKKEIKILLNRP